MCLGIIVHVCTVVLESSTLSKLQFVVLYMCVHMLVCVSNCIHVCVDLIYLYQKNVVLVRIIVQ